MTPYDWNVALAPSVNWRTAYATVVREAKAYLDSTTLTPEDGITTNELVEALYPAAKARGEAITARKRIYEGLRGWWQKDRTSNEYHISGPGRRYMGKTIYPPLWHSRREVPLEPGHVLCPHCGKTFIPGANT